MRRLILIPIVAIAVMLASSCKPQPEPGTVDLVGDSISVQAFGGVEANGVGAPEDLTKHIWFGLEAHHNVEWVQDQVASGRPETLIVALGVNDAAPRNGGWTWDDVKQWVDLLDAPHESACIVIILPAVGEGASAELHTEVAKARDGITTIAGMREGPVVIEDWADVIEADPSVLADDGVHLESDPDGLSEVSAQAAEARLAQYWRGRQKCP